MRFRPALGMTAGFVAGALAVLAGIVWFVWRALDDIDRQP